ncbi:MAG: hypothetical protein EXQ53_03415 [Acidobacteria bacterium]|nr:hypothetical protein [Acidobacteriota bacterium]
MSRVTYTNTPDRVEQGEIRAAHGVRLVSDREEGTGVNALPGGVYGYTYSPGLANAPIFATRRYRSYETHRLPSGEVFVIAYADERAAQEIASATADVTVQVHPEPSPDASSLVKISYSRIRRHRQISAPNQGGFTVTLTPDV